MANLNRILGMASKVIDKQMQKQRAQGNAAAGDQQNARGTGGGTDWRDIVRGAADKLTGDDRARQPAAGQQQYGQPQQYGHQQRHGQADPDKVALAKYDYLLRTANPDQIEQVHHDAFARLTPAQRQQVRDRLNSELPPHEHLRDDSSGGMARAMTRGEMSRPGLIRRVLGGSGVRAAAVGAAARSPAARPSVPVRWPWAVSRWPSPVERWSAQQRRRSWPARPTSASTSRASPPAWVTSDSRTWAAGVEGFAAEGEQFLGGLGEQASGSGLGEQASGLGEQASNLGNDFLGGLFDR